MELYGCDQLNCLQNNEFRSSERRWRSSSRSCPGLHICARHRHLDIKPDNILLGGAAPAKFADFCCCEAPPQFPRRQTVGTLVEAAPATFTAEHRPPPRRLVVDRTLFSASNRESSEQITNNIRTIQRALMFCRLV
jgi:serine/threonine protein kinase